MTGILGSLLSCIVVAFATKEKYGDSLNDIFEYIGTEEDGVVYTAHNQAINQLLAFIVTMIFAIVGGLMTGFILKAIGNVQELDVPPKGTTTMKLAASIQGSIASAAGIQSINFEENLFSDEIFFEVHSDEKERRETVELMKQQRRQSQYSSHSMQPSPKI